MVQGLTDIKSAVDHLLLGVADLDRGVEWVHDRLGVRAAAGGVHPGAGTRNALLSLGAGHYLEIIAPDPAQQAANDERHLRELAAPRLITFAVTTKDIDSISARARKAGLDVSGPHDGSRLLPSGSSLRWRTLAIGNDMGAGAIQPVPFFIQWSPGSPHPSSDSPKGCILESLEFQHPDSVRLKAIFEALGLDGRVSSRPDVRIRATVKSPKGRVELM